MSWRKKVSNVINPLLKMAEKGLEPERSALMEGPEAAPHAGEEASSSLIGMAAVPPISTRTSPEKKMKSVAGDGGPVKARATVEKEDEVEILSERRPKRSAEEALARLPKVGVGKGTTGQKKRTKMTVSRPPIKEMRMGSDAFARVLVDMTQAHEATRMVRAMKAEEKSKIARGKAAEGAGGSSGPQATGDLIAEIDMASALTAVKDSVVLQVDAEEEGMTLEDPVGHVEEEADAFISSMLATGGPGSEMPELGARSLEEASPLVEKTVEDVTGQEGQGGADFLLGSALAPLLDTPATQVAQTASSVQGEVGGASGAGELEEGRVIAGMYSVVDQVVDQTTVGPQTAETEGPGPSEALTGEPSRSVDMEVRGQGSSQADAALPFSDAQIKMLKELVGKEIRTQLTGDWAIPAFKAKLNKAVDGHDLAERRYENLMMRDDDMASTLREMKEACKDFDERLYDIDVLLPAVRSHGQEHVLMRRTVEECKENVNKNTRLINEAHDDVSKALAESESVKSENFRMGTEMDTFKKDLTYEARGLAARLENLEHSRREDRLSTHAGADNSIEANRLRMEGMQFFALAQASRGLFPQELLRDESFMRMIPDRSGFMIALEKGERERRGHDLSRGQIEYRHYYQDPPPPRYSQGRKDAPGSSSRK